MRDFGHLHYLSMTIIHTNYEKDNKTVKNLFPYSLIPLFPYCPNAVQTFLAKCNDLARVDFFVV